MEAIIRYFRAAAGFPFRDTWLKSIKAGNFVSWTGLAYHNAAKACHITDNTLKGHMVQVRQWVLSTKPKPTRKKCKQPEANSLPKDITPSQELHIKVEHISIFYTCDTGRLPVLSRSENQYIMIAYRCNFNAIIAAPFRSSADKYRLFANGTIMKRLKYRNILVDLYIL